MAKDSHKAAPETGTGDDAWEELQDLLAELRDKSSNNARSGSPDERHAWSGMASELDRAMRLNVRVRARLIADLRPKTPVNNEDVPSAMAP